MPSSRGPICIAAFKIVSCHTLRWWCGPQTGPNARHHNYSQILRVFPKNLLTIPAVLCDNRIIEQLPNRKDLWQHRTIPALRLKHRSGGYGTASALPKCSIRHPVLIPTDCYALRALTILPNIRISWCLRPTFMLILGRVTRSFYHWCASTRGVRPFDPGII